MPLKTRYRAFSSLGVWSTTKRKTKRKKGRGSLLLSSIGLPAAFSAAPPAAAPPAASAAAAVKRVVTVVVATTLLLFSDVLLLQQCRGGSSSGSSTAFFAAALRTTRGVSSSSLTTPHLSEQPILPHDGNGDGKKNGPSVGPSSSSFISDDNNNNSSPPSLSLYKKCVDCSAFGADSDCPVCIHNEAPAQFMMPMTPLRSSDEDKQRRAAMLEEHHRRVVEEGASFFALRGEGPFGSIGYGYGGETKTTKTTTTKLRDEEGVIDDNKQQQQQEDANTIITTNTNTTTTNTNTTTTNTNTTTTTNTNTTTTTTNTAGLLRPRSRRKTSSSFSFSSPSDFQSTPFFSFLSENVNNNNNGNISSFVELAMEKKRSGRRKRTAPAAAASSFLGVSSQKEEPITLGLASASIPITQLKDSQYVGFVSVGTPPQVFRPIFDTGSTNIWVVGKKCTEPSCTKVRRFDPEASSTFKIPNPRVVLDITFGTGRIHGSTGIDVFQVGPFKVDNQTFGLVEREEGDIFNDIYFEGIIGMAFAEMSSTGKIPFYDHILQRGVLHSSEFSFFVGDKVSALFVGGVDPRFYEPPIHMFPIVREHYWEAKLDGMWVGEKKFCCDEESNDNYVIFDSGTSFNTLPKNEINDFFKLIPREQCEGDLEREALAKYPTIRYKLSGVEVLLEPRQYVTKNAEGICLPAYMQIDVPSSFGHAYILGSIFMRHYFTVFRRGDGKSTPSMIGLAKAKETVPGDTYLDELLRSYNKQLADTQTLLTTTTSTNIAAAAAAAAA